MSGDTRSKRQVACHSALNRLHRLRHLGMVQYEADATKGARPYMWWSTRVVRDTPEELLRCFHVNYELDEMVGTQRSYAGCHTMILFAANSEDAEILFRQYISDNKLMLEGEEGDYTYGFEEIERARAVTKLDGFVGPSKWRPERKKDENGTVD